MANDKAHRTPPTTAQLQQELKALRQEYSQLKTVVNKLTDILQVQDNWHNRVSKMIGSKIQFATDVATHACEGVLLWTDRYNVGISVNGREMIFGKGHIVWLSAEVMR